MSQSMDLSKMETLQRLYADDALMPLSKLLIAQLLLPNPTQLSLNERLEQLSVSVGVSKGLVCHAFNQLTEAGYLSIKKVVEPESFMIQDECILTLDQPSSTSTTKHQVLADELLISRRPQKSKSEDEDIYRRLEQFDVR